MTSPAPQSQQRLDTLRQPFAWAITWPDDEVSFTRREPDQSIKDMDLLITPLYAASGDVRAAVIEISDKMVKAGAAAMCCQAETLGCAAKNAGNEFQTCMLSTFMQDARRCLEAALSQSPATDAAATTMVVGRVTGKLYEGDQCSGMSHAICHACGMGYKCFNLDCPNDKPNPALGNSNAVGIA